MDAFPANPPHLPLSKGGQGGFLRLTGRREIFLPSCTQFTFKRLIRFIAIFPLRGIAGIRRGFALLTGDPRFEHPVGDGENHRADEKPQDAEGDEAADHAG